jgi:hypothetical protein
MREADWTTSRRVLEVRRRDERRLLEAVTDADGESRRIGLVLRGTR